MPEFSNAEQKELLTLARNAIRNYLDTRTRIRPNHTNPRFEEKRGVFVTLHLNGELRGCIGYPLPHKSISEAVIDNAIASAFEDPRFPPLSREEFAAVDIEISILTLPVESKRAEEIAIGRDGIIISKGYNRGLLLPQVPVEQGWNLAQYLSYGCLKAGLPAEEWRKDARIEKFQAIVFGEKEGGEIGENGNQKN
jgi:AmmeMemoRadiSam system protein A